MHPRILAQRNAEASARTVAAVAKLAKRFDLDEQAKALRAEEKQPEIQQMVRNEAVAEFLETLNRTLTAQDKQHEDDLEAAKALAAQETETALLARIEVVEGIGTETMAKIRAALVRDEPKPEAPVADEKPKKKGG